MNDDNQETQSVLSADLSIDGNLEATGTIAILGTVNGQVSATKLVLEMSGKITGNVKADSAILFGHQQGNNSVVFPVVFLDIIYSKHTPYPLV